MPIRLTNIKSKTDLNHPEMDGGDLSASRVEVDGQGYSVGPGDKVTLPQYIPSVTSYTSDVVEDTGDYTTTEESRS